MVYENVYVAKETLVELADAMTGMEGGVASRCGPSTRSFMP